MCIRDRDGSAARCVLLYSGQDVVTNRLLIENSANENEELTDEERERVRKLDEERLKKMTFYWFTAVSYTQLLHDCFASGFFMW